MMTTAPHHLRRAGRRALSAAAGAALALLALAAPPAVATTTEEAAVTVTGDLGEATAAVDGPTTVQLEGSGFQVVPGGFGGVYVLFGWVAGDGWQPSRGGQSGTDYLYIPDVQTADNQGYMRYVAFPGSSTGAEANGGELAEDGSWATDLVIPGAVVEMSDATGDGREVDCRVETCGIITIGGHGVVNANNETFTPLTFVDDDGTDAGGDDAAQGEDGDAGEATDEGAGPTAEDSDGEDASPAQDETGTEGATETDDAGADTDTDAADDAESVDAAGDAAEADDSSGSQTWAVIGGIAAVAVLGAITALLLRRRRPGTTD